MKHANRDAISAVATRVWSVRGYCRQFDVTDAEEAKLIRLFGEFATECELRYNVKREPRWH